MFYQFHSFEDKLPEEKELVYILIFRKDNPVYVINEVFTSAFCNWTFLTKSLNPVPINRIYMWAPTGKYLDPLEEARKLIDGIIEETIT